MLRNQKIEDLEPLTNSNRINNDKYGFLIPCDENGYYESKDPQDFIFLPLDNEEIFYVKSICDVFFPFNSHCIKIITYHNYYNNYKNIQIIPSYKLAPFLNQTGLEEYLKVRLENCYLKSRNLNNIDSRGFKNEISQLTSILSVDNDKPENKNHEIAINNFKEFLKLNTDNFKEQSTKKHLSISECIRNTNKYRECSSELKKYGLSITFKEDYSGIERNYIVFVRNQNGKEIKNIEIFDSSKNRLDIQVDIQEKFHVSLLNKTANKKTGFNGFRENVYTKVYKNNDNYQLQSSNLNQNSSKRKFEQIEQATTESLNLSRDEEIVKINKGAAFKLNSNLKDINCRLEDYDKNKPDTFDPSRNKVDSTNNVTLTIDAPNPKEILSRIQKQNPPPKNNNIVPGYLRLFDVSSTTITNSHVEIYPNDIFLNVQDDDRDLMDYFNSII